MCGVVAILRIMNTAQLDHIGFLVSAAATAARVFADLPVEVGPTEDFPSEGTREIYVGAPTQDARILLLEPIGPGPYQSARQRRGPGLHHVALRVADLKSYVSGLQGSGWYLHPISLTSCAESGTAWLARPGTPLLVELI